ncbi:hypothetical protein F3F96_10205 [Mariprofundus sp. NF]|uniref:Wzz/FepE/Etk N-terminal domain-containing protein n=1 Tax=Mariprofundus sp. NF TaxID=2608716 RepID=UPI0015A2E41D|nr:Wzz/FepE/Etk N-terminal domain-containing protein [Mariprofundus sp. NF]NWF39505.1 hypothetical protein [Mariprofundus sp. NF]
MPDVKIERPQSDQQPDQSTVPPLDPRLLAAMYGVQDNEGIDLLEYWKMLWRKKWLIIGMVVLATVLAVVYARSLPNIYRAEVVITPVGEQANNRASLGGLGGLASMAGISLGGGGSQDVKVNLAVLTSRGFLWAFVKENKLKQILFKNRWDAENQTWRGEKGEPSQWAVYRKINSMLSVSNDIKSDLIRVAVESKDAALTAIIANAVIAKLNAHLRQQALDRSREKLGYLNAELGKVRVAEMRQALFELISQEQKRAMLASTQKEFAFRVLDAAVAPDYPFKPKRIRIVMLAMIASAFLTMIAVFLWEGWQRERKKGAYSASDK